MKPIQSFVAGTDEGPYTVQCHPYDTKLAAVFEEVKRLAQDAAGPVTVEHVGSTSIPGVGGRNALDVAIPIEESRQPAVRSALYQIGFEDSPFPHYLPLLVGRLAYQDTEYPILLYVVSPESKVYQGWIEFRDHMRSHAADAEAYDAVKRQSLAAGNVDGERYQDAKTPFLAGISAKLRRG